MHHPYRQHISALIILIALLAAEIASATTTDIYRSYESNGVTHAYSDHPINRSSRLFAVFDGNQLWPRSGSGPISSAELIIRRAQLDPLIQRIANSHGVHAALLKAVVEVESGFNARAVSPKGAIGLMQVMPATAARYGRFDLYSPEENLDVGAQYLRDLLAMFNGDVRLAVAAYNAGENAVKRSGGKIPPYPETIRYVPMVLDRYSQFRASAMR